MDMINSQFLDKMNNNIGRLHYEGKFVFFLSFGHIVPEFIYKTQHVVVSLNSAPDTPVL